MKKKLIAALAAAALAVIPATAALAQDADAEVVVVHGIPSAVFESLGVDSTAVDILINGETSALTGVEYEGSAVVPIPAGTYDLAVALPGTTEPVAGLEITGATLNAGDSVSVVAHLDADGNPVLGAYVNENDGTGIQVFHLAEFGAVDIYAGGELTALAGVENGQTARIDVDGGTTVPDVGVGVAGSGEVAIPLGDVTVPADTLVLVYAVGPEPDATPDFVIETVSVPSAEEAEEEAAEEEAEMEQPAEVDSGTGGLLDNGLPMWVAALMVLGALGVAAPAVATARRR